MALRRLLLASLGAACLAGCALGTQRFGRAIDAGRIASLEVGASSKADVLRLFGPPTAYSRLPVVPVAEAAALPAEAPGEPDPDVFVYEYREDRESFFTVILYTRFRREVVADRLMVFFDAQDRVRYVAFEEETGARGAEQ
jgi:hypothetical protein